MLAPPDGYVFVASLDNTETERFQLFTKMTDQRDHFEIEQYSLPDL